MLGIEGYMIPVFFGEVGELTKAKIAKYENSRTFAMVFSHLVDIALDSRYEFSGLPETVDDRVLKQSLLFYGNAVIFDFGGVPIALPGAVNGKAIDIYGNSRDAWIFSRNGKFNFSVPLHYKYDDKALEGEYLGTPGKSDKLENGVIIWERKTRMPFIWTVIYYAERIADTLRTLDLDRRWLKRPFIPRCEESEAKAFDESLKKFMSNEDFSVSLKAHNIDKTDIFTVEVPSELITHVTQLAEWYLSQFKMLCGISANSQVDKKGENLITAEIGVDDMYISENTGEIVKEINAQLEIYNKLTGANIKAVSIKQKEEEEKMEVFEDDAEGENIRGNGNGDAGSL